MAEHEQECAHREVGRGRHLTPLSFHPSTKLNCALFNTLRVRLRLLLLLLLGIESHFVRVLSTEGGLFGNAPRDLMCFAAGRVLEQLRRVPPPTAAAGTSPGGDVSVTSRGVQHPVRSCRRGSGICESPGEQWSIECFWGGSGWRVKGHMVGG